MFGSPTEKQRREEISHEGLVSHRSAIRSRDLRNDPDLSASNAAWSRTERRWSEGHHLRARPSSPAAGGKTRVSSRATGCPSRLLILFEGQRRYSEIGKRLLEGLLSVAREPISATGSTRPNGGRLLSSPITENERWLARAATGHAAAVPPSSVMNARLFIRSPRQPLLA